MDGLENRILDLGGLTVGLQGSSARVFGGQASELFSVGICLDPLGRGTLGGSMPLSSVASFNVSTTSSSFSVTISYVSVSCYCEWRGEGYVKLLVGVS